MEKLPSIFVANVRSLFYKIDELGVIASTLSPSIMAITETWLSEDTPDYLMSLPTYSLFRADRRNRMGGGVCAYVSDNINVKLLRTPDHPEDFESLWLFLPSISLLFVCAYVPPKVSISRANHIISFFTETVDDFMNCGFGRYLVICGDFNRLNLESLCSNNNLTALVHLPTRGNHILDNVLISDDLAPSYVSSVKAPIGSSDHNAVFCTTIASSSTQHGTSVHSFVSIYDLRSSHVQNFLTTLSAVDWTEFYDISYSIDEKCSIFHEVINLCIKESIPRTVISFVKGEKPWVTPLIKHLIDKRWAAYRSRDFVTYNYLKFKVKLEIKRAKQKWGLRAQHSPRQLWQVTNALTGRKMKSLNTLTQSFQTISEAADAINLVFASAFRPEDGPISHVSNDSLPELPLLPVSLVYKYLKQLKVGKSCGPDCIPNLLYKKSALLLAEPLCHLFNACLTHGIFPSYWKQATIVPVPKVPRPTLGELRPISLLCSPSKIFEKVIANQLMHLFRVAAGPEQHGCFGLCSTTTASIMIHDHVTMLLDIDNVCGVQIISYDISKAFDQINHRVILSRLVESSFPRNVIALITSYLSNRLQRVRINGVQSTSAPITSGVPQGSILGPLFFSAVMGKLKRVNGFTGLIKFVDDITLVVPVFRADANQHITDEDTNVRQWAGEVGLAINHKKSKCLAIRKSPTFSPVNLPMMNVVDRHKILGIVWSDDLKWIRHFEAISRMFASRLHCLRVLRNVLQKEELIAVYSSLLRSLLEYCSPLFIGISKDTSKQLEKLQKRAHKIICGRGCNCQRFSTISERREIQATALYQKAKINMHPLNCLLPPKSDRTSRYILPLYKTSRRCSSFIPSMLLRECGLLYNNLSQIP